jgi:hypothetical protein
MGRYLGLAKETAYGTAVAPATYMRILNETIKFNPNFVYHRTIEGGRKLQTTQAVKQQSQGSIRFMPVYDKGLGEILNMLFGKVTTTVLEASVRWQHVFEPLATITSNVMPSYTIEKGLDDITGERYSGCSVGRLRINANPADFVVVDADIFGKKPSTVTLATPSFSSQDYINAGQVVTQTLGGVTTKFEQFSVEIIGGAVPAFKPSSKEPDSIDIDPVMVTASFVTRFLSSADLTDFLNATQKVLVYKWQGPTLGAGNYSLQLDLPKLNFDEGDVVVNEQDRLVQARNVTAIADANNDLIKMTLVNGVSGY